MNSLLKYIHNKGQSRLMVQSIIDYALFDYVVCDGVLAVFANKKDLLALNIVDNSGNLVDTRDKMSENLSQYLNWAFSDETLVCQDTKVIFVYSDGKYIHLYNDGSDLIGINDEFVQQILKYDKNAWVDFYTLKTRMVGFPPNPIFFSANKVPFGFVMPIRFTNDVERYLVGLKINGEFPTLHKAEPLIPYIPQIPQKRGVIGTFSKLKKRVLNSINDDEDEDDLPF